MKYKIKVSLFAGSTPGEVRTRGDVYTAEGDSVMLAETEGSDSFLWVMHQIWRFMDRRHATMTGLKVADVYMEGRLRGTWTAEAA